MNFDSLPSTAHQILERVRRRFFRRPNLLLLGKDSAQFLPGESKRTQVVLSRFWLKHGTFSLPPALPASQLGKTLGLMIQRWSPFADTGDAVQWRDRNASVYVWDRSKVSAAIAAAGHDPLTCKVVPETFLRDQGNDGVRLVKAIDGVEGQVWNLGLLAATRWWPRTPSTAEWATFVRAAPGGGDLAAISAPEPADVPWRETPWATAGDLAEDTWELIASPRYRPVAIGVAATVPVFLIAQWLSLSTAGAGLQTDLNRLMKASEPVRAQQDAVIANLDAIDALLALERLPNQFAVMARAFQLLQGFNVQIVDWTYDLGSLEVSLEGKENLDATRFIEAFERDDLFAAVSARTLPQPFTLRLKMEVTPVQETGA